MTPLLDGSPVGLLISGAIVAMILGLGLLMLAPTIKARSPTIPIAGLLLVSPVAVVVIDGARWSTEALIGLAVLVGTGLVVPEHYPPFVKGAASIPGAAVLSIGTDNRTAVFLLVGIPVLSTAVARFEDGHDYEHGLSAMCAAIAGGGVFLTVPDTENTALLAGAGIVVGLLVLAEPRLTLGWSRYTWAGAFFLALAVDGAPRTTATIGGIAALGLILIDPVVRAITKVGRGLLTYLPTQGERQQLLATATLQSAIALFSARVVGFQSDVVVAVTLAVVAYIVTAVALVLGAGRATRPTGIS